jgi:hypothetical protein
MSGSGLFRATLLAWILIVSEPLAMEPFVPRRCVRRQPVHCPTPVAQTRRRSPDVDAGEGVLLASCRCGRGNTSSYLERSRGTAKFRSPTPPLEGRHMVSVWLDNASK